MNLISVVWSEDSPSREVGSSVMGNYDSIVKVGSRGQKSLLEALGHKS